MKTDLPVSGPSLGRPLGHASVRAWCLVAVLCLLLSAVGCQTTSKQSAAVGDMSPPPPSTDAERLGDQYMSRNMAKAAIPQFQKAQAAGAPTASTAWRLGNAYFTLRQWDNALDAFHQALEADPTMAIAYEGAGFAAFELGKFKESTLYFEETTELAPDHWVPHAFLAALYRLDGKMPQATAAKDKGLELAGEANRLMAVETIKRALVKGVSKQREVAQERGETPQGDMADTEPLPRVPASSTPAASGVAPATPDEILDPLSSDMGILGLDTPAATQPAPKAATRATPVPAAKSTAKAPAAAANQTVAVLSNEGANGTSDTIKVMTANATTGKTVRGQKKAIGASATRNATATRAPAQARAVATSATKPVAAPPKPVNPRTVNATKAATALPKANVTKATPAPAPAKVAAPTKAATAGNATARPKATPAAAKATPAAAKATPKAATPKMASNAAKPAPKPSAAAPEAAPKAPAAANATKVAPKPVPAAKATPTKTATAPPKAPAPKKAPEPVAAKKSDAKTAAKVDPRPGEPFVYSVLESSWKHRDQAIVRSNALKKQGVRAQIMRADLGTSGIYYRVMIGTRKNKKDIMDIKKQLESRFGLKDIIILRIRPGSLEE